MSFFSPKPSPQPQPAAPTPVQKIEDTQLTGEQKRKQRRRGTKTVLTGDAESFGAGAGKSLLGA